MQVQKKYAILGDIHSNLEALQVVLADAEKRGVTHYACVGDVVGYNANPAECIDILRELNAVTVRGNHDHYCAFEERLNGFHPLAADVINWTRKQLSPDQMAFLGGLNYSLKLENFTLVHSTLDTPEMWGYVFDRLEAEANFNYQTTQVCFFGHTHVPLAFEKAGDVTGGEYTQIKTKFGQKYFINVGSVGQPRDGNPKCAYATYDIKTQIIELHRLDYDIEKTQSKILNAGLPDRLAARLALGR
ncbi:MAG: metallophosphoesterase family protein [Kiritimatiellia bacterium]|nr:metallophosphoesterase family protein [Kiritimatiellia bacterium]